MTVEEAQSALIGKRIVAISVQDSRTWDISIDWIRLDDGTVIDISGEPAFIHRPKDKR